VGTGIGGTAGDGGLAINAEIGRPLGLNFDNSGNLLVIANALIRKVDRTTTIISTIAGSDTATNQGGNGDGGPALEAFMFEPYAICTDTAGNYYILDYLYCEVRKVDITTGIIDTFAGCKQSGNMGDGGPAKLARFSPFSIYMDTAHGYMYISDEWNHRIRRVNMSTGIVTAFAGTGTDSYSGDGGPALSATFSRTIGICVDRHGNVYVGDWDNARIRKVDYATGIVTTVAGNGISGYSGDGGLAINAMLTKPTAICFDKYDNLYFSDENNQRVRKVDAVTGIISTVAGNGDSSYYGDGGPAVNAALNHPTGICIDDSMNLFVSDWANNRVRKIALGDQPESVTNTSLSNIFYISPNPAKESITLTSDIAKATISIVNELGQTLMRQDINGGKTQINIQQLEQGRYYIIMEDPATGSRTSKRFVKE
jgi:hypothetical protein